MRIWIDPDKAAADDISASEILSALRAQNVQVSAGVLNAPPMTSHAAYEINVEALGRLDDTRAVRRHHRQVGQPRARHPHPRHRPRRARLSRLRLHRLCGYDIRPLPGFPSPPRARTWCSSSTQIWAKNGGAQEDVSRRAWTTSTSMIRRPSSSQSIHEVIMTMFIAIATGGRRGVPVPADLAGYDHPGGRHPDIARRHFHGPVTPRHFHQQSVDVRSDPGRGHRCR